MDNNAAEQSIRGFCVGKKNWVMIDTIAGAESSAIIYSLAETAKANNLKPYDYFKYLLTEIPKHLDDKNDDFCESLLPWSENLPADCKRKIKLIAARLSGKLNDSTDYGAFTSKPSIFYSCTAHFSTKIVPQGKKQARKCPFY